MSGPGPHCGSCKLYRGVAFPYIQCEGSAENGIMLTGEAPGAVEDQQGRPFVGDAGIRLNWMLKSAEIERDECAINNACRCKPPGDRDPTKEEKAACRSYLVDDIQRLKPRVVALMGNVALNSVLGLRGITKQRGSVLTNDAFPGTLFVPMFHPAMILRRWEERRTIEHDLKLVAKIAREGYQKIEVNYRTLRSVSEIEHLLNRLRDSTTDYVVFDVETTGYNPRECKILCISFSNRVGTGWVVPLRGKELREIWSEDEFSQIVALLKTFLEDPSIPKSAQNGVFDILFLRSDFGIEVAGWVFDSMNMHHAVDENLPHGLDFTTSWYTDIDPYKAKLYKHLPKQGASFALVPEEVLWHYSASDSDAQYRVSRAVEQEAIEDDVREVHDRIMMPLARVLAEAEWDGVRVDTERLDGLHEEYMEKHRGIEQEIFKQAGGEFNIDSWKQRARILFDKLGLPMTKKTSGGNPSTDAEALAEIAKLHPIAQKMIDRGSIAHDIKTYLKGLDGKTGILKYLGSDGRVHPGWMQHRAVTGRLACADPNVQSQKKYGPFRPLFAATEDWYWIAGDYSQMEVRVVAFVAPDETLQRLFDEGKDVHRMVACQPKVFNCLYEEVTERQRDSTKGIVFGINYGRTAYTIAVELGIPIKEAEEYIQAYFDLFQGIFEHHQRTMRLVDETSEVQTAFKRKRHLYGASDLKRVVNGAYYSEKVRKDAERALREIYRQAINCTVQSPANDILSLACIRVYKRFKRDHMQSRLLISHHDAGHWEAPEEELEDAVGIIKEEMERPVPEFDGAVFPVEFEIGRFWSDDSVKVKGIN